MLKSHQSLQVMFGNIFQCDEYLKERKDIAVSSWCCINGVHCWSFCITELFAVERTISLLHGSSLRCLLCSAQSWSVRR